MNLHSRHSAQAKRRRRALWVALLLAAALFAGRPAAADRWVIECADCPRYFDTLTDRSLRLDAAGHPRAAYGGDHLYYARHDGSQWQIEVVDPDPGVGGYASLALDGSGYAHIAYYDAAQTGLRYAYQASGSGEWQVQAVDTGSVGMYTSLAVGASGRPHIAYRGPGSVKYAYYDQAGWHLEVVDEDVSAIFKHISLALDQYGRPRISYFLDDDVDSNWDVRYAYRDQTGWHVQVVDETPESSGGDTSLAVDAGGRPHVSYIGRGYDDYDVEYATNPGSGWVQETVDANVDGYGGHTSLALDGAGRPRVSYYDARWGDVNYADRDSGDWEVETVDPAASDGYTSLAVDAGGAAHVLYFHTGSYLLEHAVQTGGEWQVETVDTGRAVGEGSSLKLDGQQAPHISSVDLAQNEIRYAVRGGGRQADGAWTAETVADAGDGSYDTSLAVDGGGVVHVGYYYEIPLSSAQQLEYAYRDASGWHVEQLYSMSLYGGSLSLALAPDGQPCIGYSDSAVVYAWRTTSGWQKQGAAGLGQDVSMALTAGGWPRVSFYESMYHRLVFAYKDDAGWHSEMVESDVGASGGHPSLAVDASGNPHLSYFTGLPNAVALKYAFKDGDGWHVEVVDAGVGGRSTSIALGADGAPRIAYQSYVSSSQGYLKYASRETGGWAASTVPAGGAVFDTVSLALDGDDLPHISFYDDTTKDLMYARYVVQEHGVYLPLVVWR